jgi:hypothetical protein
MGHPVARVDSLRAPLAVILTHRGEPGIESMRVVSMASGGRRYEPEDRIAASSDDEVS